MYLFATLLFLICISLQIISLFSSNLKVKIYNNIGAAVAAIILSFVSTVGPLWLIAAFFCSLNAYLAYSKLEK